MRGQIGGGEHRRPHDQPKTSFPPHDVECKPEIPKHWHPSGCVKKIKTQALPLLLVSTENDKLTPVVSFPLTAWIDTLGETEA